MILEEILGSRGAFPQEFGRKDKYRREEEEVSLNQLGLMRRRRIHGSTYNTPRDIHSFKEKI